MDIILQIKESINSYIKKNFSNFSGTSSWEITLNTDQHKQQFGDLNTNVALILSKQLKKLDFTINAKDLAVQIKEHLKLDQFSDLIEKIEVVGPGFINIFLTLTAFQKLALELFTKKEDYFKSNNNIQNYSIEYVSANPTGPLHIGHGRGGIIGDVLSKILKFQNNSVTKEFYVNDAGIQIQKLGKSLKFRCLQLLDENSKNSENKDMPEDLYQGEYLIKLAKNFISENQNLSKQNLENLSDNSYSNYAKEHLLEAIKSTLKDYGIIYDVWFSEKSLHDSRAIEKSIEKLDKKGYIYEKDGAFWFKSTEFGDDKDRVIKKVSGEYTYVAPDIAYLENKINRKADKLIMILGQDHHGYVQRLKGLMQALGYDPDRLDVILYQLVTLKESGETLRLSKRAGRIVDLHDVIETVGKDVARFFYLNKKADAHLDFDLSLALKKTDENPVYYIQYAYVRTKSILNKAETELNYTLKVDDYKFINNSEKLLIKKIISLKSLLSCISKNYQVHLLTYYVLELAQNFHSYYSKHKVINKSDINQSSGRLFITKILQDTFKTCFDLLGISAPEHM